MKWIETGIRYIQVNCLFFSFDCCCKGVITLSCLPGSSQRMLPLLQYFNFHGVKAAAAGYVYFCRYVYVCIHRLPAARRKKKLQKKKNVSQVLESKFVIFSRSRSENAGLWGAQNGFFNKGKLVILRNATTL